MVYWRGTVVLGVYWCTGVLGGVLVYWGSTGVLVYWRCIGGVLVYWWCTGVLAVYRWCTGGVLGVYWCCSGGVLVLYWWQNGYKGTGTPNSLTCPGDLSFPTGAVRANAPRTDSCHVLAGTLRTTDRKNASSCTHHDIRHHTAGRDRR